MLVLFLVISSVMLIENRMESLLPRVKDFAELKIEEAFGDKFLISIESLEGGVVNPFTLNNVVIKNRKGERLFPYLEITSIKSNYRIWDMLFNKDSGFSRFSVFSNKPYVYMKFVTRKKELAGLIRIDGNMKDAGFKGYIELLEKERITFTGNIRSGTFEMMLKPKEGLVEMKGKFSDDRINATAVISHLKFSNFDISSAVSFDSTFSEGEFKTSDLTLNYKPYMNIGASYKISDGIMHLRNVELGKNIKLEGQISLNRPYAMDFTLTTDNLNLNNTIASLVANYTPVISGTLNAKFNVSGPANKLKMAGRMEMKQGMIGLLDFEYLSANLRGDLPMVRIEESRITRQSGYLSLGGEIDLSRVGRGNPFEGIKLTSDETAIMWDIWDTTKTHNLRQIQMTKKVNDDINFGFKKFIDDKNIDESLREKDEMELEYKLHPNESLKMSIGQDNDFIGLEHKDKF